MVNNKIAQRAVAAGLSGLMAFGAAAPAALAYTPQDFKWYNVNSNDDGVYWKRLSGDDRYGTMKEIVKAYNEYERVTGINIYGLNKESDYNYHGTAVIASGDNFPDALAANGLAGYLTNMNLTTSLGNNGSVPVILTKSGKLSNEAKDLLKYMQVQEAIVMGGTAAISQDVEDAIAKMGIRVSRIAGADRQETSLKALQAINGNWKGRKGTWDLIIATGDNYADALSISPYAYRMGTPIVLTKKDGTLTDAEVEAIRSNDDIREILIVGGTSAVSDQVMGQIGTINKNKLGVQFNRIAGVDRYETSAKIAQFEVEAWTSLWNGIAGFSFDHAIVATGENFPDALAGGQLAGGIGDLKANTTLSGDKAVTVDGFTGYNEWCPCPLLLVKDGDLRADSIISWGLNREQVATTTATFTSWASWVNTVNGWYGKSTDEYEELYGDSLVNSAFHAWYDDAKLLLYISDKAIESVDVADATTRKGTDAYSKTDETVKFKVEEVAGVNTVTEVTVTKSINGTTYTYTLTERDDANNATVNDNANGFFWNTDLNGDGTEDDKVIEYWYTDDVNGVKYRRINKLNSRDAKTDEYHYITPTATEMAREDTYTKNVTIWDSVATTDDDEFRSLRRFGGWATEVIGCVDVSEDFYGIILGGTAAVSNKKRDDLDDVIKANTFTDNVYTVGGEAPEAVVRFSEDWGINLNYSRLIPVSTVKNEKSFNYDGDTYAKGTLKADVYRVAGTNAYVLVVMKNSDSELVDWIYYPKGATSDLFKNNWK